VFSTSPAITTPSVTGDLTMSTGNVVMSNGKGIDFSATPGTGTSELLDDYEEGTFTPIIIGTTTAGTGTYTTNSGRYTKIGDLVYIQLQIDQTNHTGTGNMRITGLPFTSQSGQQSPFVTTFNNLALTAGYFGASALGSNFGTIKLSQYPTGGGGAAFVPMDTSCYIELAGCYKA
jgi:hypothetical protein